MSFPRSSLVAVSLLAGLLLVELGARLLLPPPQFHSHPLQLDYRLGFRAIPSRSYVWVSPEAGRETHEVVFNRDGFRGRALPAERAREGPLRIAFLGDSFLVGEAVPASALMTESVERAMDSVARPVEVYNLSTIDYGTGQQLLLLDQLAERLSPDVVVLALYPANDVANNSLGLAGRTRTSPGDAIRPYVQAGGEEGLEVEWHAPLRSFLRRTLRTYALVERAIAPPRIAVADRASSRQRIERGDMPREFLEFLRDHPAEHRWETAWRETESLLRALRDRCDALGARLLVVVIPAKHQVVETPQTIGYEIETKAAGRDLAALVDWDLPEIRLGGFFEREGIDSRILLPRLRIAAQQGQEVYAHDQHLSEAGHAIATAMIVEALGGTMPLEPGAELPSLEAPAGPVSWRGARDPTWLDLRRAPMSRHFSEGWLEWQPPGPRHPGGWLIGRKAVVALRARPGLLVVRGFALSALDLDIGFVGGGPGRRVRLAAAGPFEARLEVDDGILRTTDGHAAIVLDAGASVGQVILQQIGFAGRGERTKRSAAASGADHEHSLGM